MANDSPSRCGGALARGAWWWVKHAFHYEDHRASLVSVFLTVLASVAFGFGLSNLLYFELYLLGVVELGFFALVMATLIDLRCNGAVNRVAWVAVTSFGGLSLGFYGIIEGAYDASVWLLWFPFVAFFLLGTRWGMGAVVVYYMIVVVMVGRNFGNWPSISDTETLTNIFGALAAICWLTFYQERFTERAYQRIFELANTDVLTGISNRRSFVEQFEQAKADLTATDQPGALLLIDIDKFKEINDSHGHTVGDMVIKEVTARISGAVRKGEIVGRLGGEEFGVLLTGCNAGEAARRGDEIRARIAAEPVAPEVDVTISVGVVSVDGRSGDFGAVFATADERLYQAKAQGRNRTVSTSRV